jgi:hypothetical protein
MHQSAESACGCAGDWHANWLRSVITIVAHQILQTIQNDAPMVVKGFGWHFGGLLAGS